MNPEIISWLLDGDPSIRWQVGRDLLDQASVKFEAERKKVSQEGWGKRLLDLQDADGRWGGGMYGPKFISTTYTMLTDLALKKWTQKMSGSSRLGKQEQDHGRKENKVSEVHRRVQIRGSGTFEEQRKECRAN